MHVSPARLAANRRNALASTGPKTDEGKAASRRNALKHGLCSNIVVLEDFAVIERSSENCFQALKPQNEYQAWACDQVAVALVRIDRLTRMERRVRDKESLRAEVDWDGDRRMDAEATAVLLASRPAQTAEALRQTPHGCEWLMSRWAMLAHAADTQAGQAWTPEQVALAFDLMGTPAVFRVGRLPGTELDLYGRVVAEAGDPATFARRMIGELEARRDEVLDLDEVDKALTIADLSGLPGVELRKLRRYESALHARLRWLVAQVGAPADKRKIIPYLRDKWRGHDEPAPPVEEPTAEEVAAEFHDPNSSSPPFDLEPDEAPQPGQKPDLPMILRGRRQKREARVEARQASRRKKLDRLRN